MGQMAVSHQSALEKADALERAVRQDYHSQAVKEAVEATVAALEAALVTWAYDEGLIAGKNAEQRKRSEAVFLHDPRPWNAPALVCLALKDYRGRVVRFRRGAAQARAELENARAQVGLMKAWLYSQGGGTG